MRDIYNNTMKDCGLYSGQNIVFYRFSLTKFVCSLDGINEHIDILYLILKSTSYEYIFSENVIDKGDEADCGHYRPPAAVI